MDTARDGRTNNLYNRVEEMSMKQMCPHCGEKTIIYRRYKTNQTGWMLFWIAEVIGLLLFPYLFGLIFCVLGVLAACMAEQADYCPCCWKKTSTELDDTFAFPGGKFLS
jgi:hypothetical protein